MKANGIPHTDAKLQSKKRKSKKKSKKFQKKMATHTIKRKILHNREDERARGRRGLRHGEEM